MAVAGGAEPFGALEELTGREPTPQFALQMAEQCEALLAQLNQVERRTAELKLQAFTQQEIAEQMDCGVRTVERRLSAVRRIWTKDS